MNYSKRNFQFFKKMSSIILKLIEIVLFKLTQSSYFFHYILLFLDLISTSFYILFDIDLTIS